MGMLTSAEGGAATADVIPEESPEPFLRKRLGPVRYEPIRLSFGLAMASPLFDWIRASWEGKSEQRSGSIVSFGAAGAASALDFSEAVVAETTLPRLDAAAKSQLALSLTVEPKETRRRPASGAAPPPVQKQKQWLAANFRLEIDGLDCTRVSSVEALTIASASPVDFPALRVTLSASTQESWADWHDEFVVQGQNDEAHEKSGVLRYLAPNLASDIGRVELSNLGIFRLAPVPVASPDAVARVVADLYCERLELVV
jgi:hypothetical protein